VRRKIHPVDLRGTGGLKGSAAAAGCATCGKTLRVATPGRKQHVATAPAQTNRKIHQTTGGSLAM
jgi:hypothetical protein